MIVCVVDQAVIGKDDPLGTPAGLAPGVDVTFCPGAAGLFGKQTLPVAEPVAADGAVLYGIFGIVVGIAQILTFCLGDIVFRQMGIQVDVKGHIFL